MLPRISFGFSFWQGTVYVSHSKPCTVPSAIRQDFKEFNMHSTLGQSALGRGRGKTLFSATGKSEIERGQCLSSRADHLVTKAMSLAALWKIFVNFH